MTNLPIDPSSSLIGLLLAAFLIGLSSSGHCLLMCGGISSALSSRLSNESSLYKFNRLILFHLGRISCYSLLGLVLGGIIEQLLQVSHTLVIVARIIAAAMIIAIGLYVAGFSHLVRLLEKRLAFIWKKIQPLAQKFIPMQQWHHALFLGFLWGFLPCGMIYSTLLWASSNNQGALTGLLMFSFGLGTLPSLFIANWFSLQALAFLQKQYFKRITGLLLIVFGLWSLGFLFMPSGQHHHSNPAPSSENNIMEKTEMDHSHHLQH